jgi:hypothetical protein
VEKWLWKSLWTCRTKDYGKKWSYQHCSSINWNHPGVLHATPIRFFWFDQFTDNWWGGQIVKLIIMPFLPLSCYLPTRTHIPFKAIHQYRHFVRVTNKMASFWTRSVYRHLMRRVVCEPNYHAISSCHLLLANESTHSLQGPPPVPPFCELQTRWRVSDQITNTWWGGQIVKLIIMPFLPLSCYLLTHHATRHNTPNHNILSTAPQFSISLKALGTLPEDGNVMPKHVRSTIHN